MRWIGLARFYFDAVTKNYAERVVTHPNYVFEGKLKEWGFIDLSIPTPSGPPQIGEMRVRVEDVDGTLRNILARSAVTRRFVDIRFLQEGGSWNDAPFQLKVQIQRFQNADRCVEFTLKDRMADWIDESFPLLINQANFPDFPQVETAWLNIVFGHVVSKAVPVDASSGGARAGAPSPSSGLLTAAADATTVLANEIDNFDWAAVPYIFTWYAIVKNLWNTLIASKYATALSIATTEFFRQRDAGTLDAVEGAYAINAVTDLWIKVGNSAADFIAIFGWGSRVIDEFNASQTVFYGLDLSTLIQQMSDAVAEVESPGSGSLVIPQGRIPLPYIGWNGVIDRWGAAGHLLWDCVALYRKKPGEGYFTPVDIAEFTVTAEDRVFTEFPGKTWSCTFIDFLVQQPKGTEIRMDADGFFFFPEWNGVPAAGYDPDNGFTEQGPRRNPAEFFILMADWLMIKAGMDAFNADELGALRDSMKSGTSGAPPLYADTAISDQLTPREFISRWASSFQTDPYVDRLGLLTAKKIDEENPYRPVITREMMIDGALVEDSPSVTTNRLVGHFTRNTAADTWDEQAIIDNLQDQVQLGLPIRGTYGELQYDSADEIIRDPRVEKDDIFLWYVSDLITAQSVMTHRLGYLGLGSFTQAFKCSLPAVVSIAELANQIGLTHPDGLDIGGYLNREVKTTQLTLNLAQFEVMFKTILRIPLARELPNPVIVMRCPAGMQVGVPYTTQFFSEGGVPPYTWALTSGAFPDGLSLIDDILSGTPTSSSPASWEVTVTDAIGQIAVLSCESIPAPGACSPWSNTTEGMAGPVVKPGGEFSYRLDYVAASDLFRVNKMNATGDIVASLIVSTEYYTRTILRADSNYLYVGSSSYVGNTPPDPFLTKVWRVHLSDFTTVDEFALPDYRGEVRDLAVSNGWLYILTEQVATTHNGLLYRLLLSDFASLETIDWSDGNNVGFDNQKYMVVDSGAVFIAYTNNFDSVGKYRVAKLIISGSVAFDSVLIVTCPSNSGSLSGMAQDSGNVYAAYLEGTTTSTIARIIKSSLALSDLKQYSLPAPVAGATGWIGLIAVGGNLYSALVNRPTRIGKIDSANLSSYELMTLSAGVGYIGFTDGSEFYIETALDGAGSSAPRLRHLCEFIPD